MFEKRMIISYELCLDDNDWNEISRALPELAKRRVITGNTLADEFSSEPFKHDFYLFLESLGISFAKDIRAAYEEDNFLSFEDIDVSGLSDAIYKIDTKVEDYINSNDIKLKASDFRNKEEFEHWVDNKINKGKLGEALWEVISNNQDNPLVDKIISELGEC